MEENRHHHHEEHHHHHEEMTKENILKLLQYMLDHNRHHTEELEDATALVSEEAAELIHEAVAAYEEGNTKLEAALHKMEEE